MKEELGVTSGVVTFQVNRVDPKETLFPKRLPPQRSRPPKIKHVQIYPWSVGGIEEAPVGQRNAGLLYPSVLEKQKKENDRKRQYYFFKNSTVHK